MDQYQLHTPEGVNMSSTVASSVTTMTPIATSLNSQPPSPTLNASSAIKRSSGLGLSITLPRNFAPLSLDPAQAPRTPDQGFAQLELPLPPPPRHSTFRVRRPRINLEHFQSRSAVLAPSLFASEIPVPSSAGPLTTQFSIMDDLSSDLPMPSVERDATPVRPQLLQSYSEPIDSQRLHLLAGPEAPCTPVGQTVRLPMDMKSHEWDLRRSDSVSSQRSDSSLSTTETCETRPTSFEGSVVSANDGGLDDPFSPTEHVKVIPATPQRQSKKARLANFFSKSHVHWTIEMDNHLFNVYQLYLADPTVTPFKTVPGSIPPTGVCHRVARRAKETWSKATRISVPIVQRYKVRSMLDVHMTPRAKTPDPDDFLNSGAVTRPQWPSESITRKRLKQLCREKFMISAHYNRLRESRSPSPFADQFAPRRPSRLSASPMQAENENLFNTRELHINLVASGATEPLKQLTTGDSPVASALESFNQQKDHIEQEQISRSSPPTGLGISQDDSKLAPAANDIPRLASPFAYNTWNGPVRPDTKARRLVSQNHFDTMHVTGPRLQSPFQPDGDFPNINKRRAVHNLEDELSPSGSSLAGHTSGLNLNEPPPSVTMEDDEQKQELVFQGFGDINHRRVRLVRNRGATLGSAHERISRMFAPPTPGEPAPAVPAIPVQFSEPSPGLLPPPKEAPRLGSPFELDPNKRSIRTKPRHLPSLSDPFIQFTHGVPTSTTGVQTTIGNIGDRLATFEQSLDDYRAPSQD